MMYLSLPDQQIHWLRKGSPNHHYNKGHSCLTDKGIRLKAGCWLLSHSSNSAKWPHPSLVTTKSGQVISPCIYCHCPKCQSPGLGLSSCLCTIRRVPLGREQAQGLAHIVRAWVDSPGNNTLLTQKQSQPTGSCWPWQAQPWLSPIWPSRTADRWLPTIERILFGGQQFKIKVSARSASSWVVRGRNYAMPPF